MNELRSKIEAVISEGFREETLTKAKKQIKDLFVEAESDFEYWIKADISYNLARFVEEMAENALTAILEGDDEQMRRYLKCDTRSYTGRDREHPVIHGRLFEAQAIELRKRIVDAHAELLKSERVLDLEAQVKSLVSQVTRVNQEKDAMCERVREYSSQ